MSNCFQKYNFENIFTKVMLKNLSTQELPLMNMVGTAKVQEKLLLQGRRALSEIELLALILNQRDNSKLSLQTAARILNYCENNLQDLARLSIEELKSIEGMSINKAMCVAAVFEIANRKQGNTSLKRIIKKSKDAYEVFRPYFSDLSHEEFYITFLNRANKVIRVELLSIGGISGTVVDIRLIMNRALIHKSSAILVAHNHPSESLKPSEPDIQLTQRLKEACAIFDILMMDHLILGSTGYFSFADEGIL